VQTGADLAHERRVLTEVLGWTPDALAALDRDSIDAAFLTDAALDRDSIDAAFLTDGERHELLARLAGGTGSP